MILILKLPWQTYRFERNYYMNIPLRYALFFLAGCLFTLSVSFADFEVAPNAPIYKMDSALLKMNLNGIMEAGSKLIDKCYDKQGRFNRRACKPALEEFKVHLYNTSENLYCPHC
jgi:hypothetical protein